MGWIAKNLDTMRKLPDRLLIAHMFAKFLSGLGIGIILAGKLDFNWRLWGTVFIVLSVAVSVPSGRIILRK